jgi:hypothetical protein
MCCHKKTIFYHLPQDVKDIICGYVSGVHKSHLKCTQCDFIDRVDVKRYIEKNYNKYNYHEEYPPVDTVEMMINTDAIRLFDSNNWSTIKNNYEVLDVTERPEKGTFLLQLSFIDWINSNKTGLVKNDKIILFELPCNNDPYMEVILFLSKISMVRYIKAIDPYEYDNPYSYDNPYDYGNQLMTEEIEDDFVIWNDNFDDDDEFYVSANGSMIELHSYEI